jgi:hypothetical protein
MGDLIHGATRHDTTRSAAGPPQQQRKPRISPAVHPGYGARYDPDYGFSRRIEPEVALRGHGVQSIARSARPIARSDLAGVRRLLGAG